MATTTETLLPAASLETYHAVRGELAEMVASADSAMVLGGPDQLDPVVEAKITQLSQLAYSLAESANTTLAALY